MYWRYDEEVHSIELDYPRDMQMWKGVPYNIDAVFQYHDRKTYFFKGKHFWEFDDQRMEVTAAGPVAVGEGWLHCPKELHDPFTGDQQEVVVSDSPSPGLHSILLLLSWAKLGLS